MPSKRLCVSKTRLVRTAPVESKPTSCPQTAPRDRRLIAVRKDLQRPLSNVPTDAKPAQRPSAVPPAHLVCQTCGKTFSKKSNLIVHIRDCTPKPATTLRCDFCSREFAYLHSLRRHRQKCGESAGAETEPRDTGAAGREDGAAKTAPPKSVDEVAGRTNSDRVTSADEGNCAEAPDDGTAEGQNGDVNCAASGRSEETVEGSRSEERVDGAAGCERGVKAAGQFEKMAVTLEGRRCYQCDRCGYVCVVASRMRLHYSRHTGERPYTCEQCGRQFRLLSTLRTHVKSVHEGVRQFGCEVCGRRFGEKRYLQVHRDLHAGQRRFVCDVCGARFAHLPSLQAHQRTHASAPSFRCQLCPNAYTHVGSFRLHMKRHRGELNYRCAVCDKAFVDRQHLSRHLAVHSEERPFECDVCGATFKLLKYLQSHRKTHGKVTVAAQRLSGPYADCAEHADEDDSSTECVPHAGRKRIPSATKRLSPSVEEPSADIVVRKKSRLPDCATAPIATPNEAAPKDNVVFTPLVIIPKTIVASYAPPAKAASAKASADYWAERRSAKTEAPPDYWAAHEPPKKEAPQNCWARRKAPKQEEPLITCDDCEFTSKTMRAMMRHYRTTHPDGLKDARFSCFHCDRVFSSKSHVARHILEVHLGVQKRSGGAVVTCDICQHGCASKRGLRRHMALHHSPDGGAVKTKRPRDKFNYGYCCDICGRGYEKQHEMLAHRDVYHAGSPPISWRAFQKIKHKMMLCAACKFQYRMDRFAAEHTCIGKEENAAFEERMTEALRAKPRFRCSVCSFSSVWKAVLRQHWEKAHAEAAPIDWDALAAVEVRHYCAHCCKAFDVEADAADHFCAEMELESKPKSYVCSVCEVGFQRQYTYRRHRQIRHGIFGEDEADAAVQEAPKCKAPIACPFCETTSRTRARMLEHIKEAHNVDTVSPFMCIACGKVFQRKAALDEHNLAYHPKDEKLSAENERALRENQILLNGEVVYHCNVCNRNYEPAHRFLVHYRLHFVERKYVCHLCGKQTRTQNHLMTHIKSFHLNIREYKCDLCHKGFYSKLILEQHRRIHTGERPFACEVCGKTFNSSSALLSHKKFHDDFFPHQCHLCPKKFKIRRCLVNHIRIHTGERPFQCELCAKTYSDPSRFSYHKKVTHSDERRVECKVCGKRYKANKYLYRHMKSHQTETSEAVE